MNNTLTNNEFLSVVPEIDRACTTVIENIISIFVPHKRIDKSLIQKEFDDNNRVLVIENTVFDKVEIRGRLLGQTHKDILEVLLTSDKTYSKETKQFKIKTTSYAILKKLGKDTSNRKWLIKKIEEIAECRVKLFFKETTEKQNIAYSFGFIGGILDKDEKEIYISFTPEYTHFMAKNELLDYSNYVEDIIQLKSPFIKAIVRYMLTNKGNNSQISIEKLLEKLKLKKLISLEQLKDELFELKSEEMQEILLFKFGISLTNNNDTLTFKSIISKPHYHIKAPILKAGL